VIKHSLRILITAGPTIEPIDPVRVISNRSTGLFGYELAREAKKRKYKVTLISGPTNMTPPAGVKVLYRDTARSLRDTLIAFLAKSDILIMASAVSDFRPACLERKKLKSRKTITLKLIRNPDILMSIPAKMRKNKFLVGFSLETENLLKNAAKKLKKKHLDLIIANKAGRSNIPFGSGRKTVYIVDKCGVRKKLQNLTKARAAGVILDTIEELCYTPG